MVDEYTVPFAGTPLEVGRILVYVDSSGGNLWELVEHCHDGRWVVRCPFNRHRTDTFAVTLGPNEWVGPDLPSVLAYLRLMGMDAT